MIRSRWCLWKTFPRYLLRQCSRRSVPRVGKFKKKTQTQQKAARWQRASSLHELKQEVNGVQELYPLLRVEEREDQPGLHAVSDSSRWMCSCPLTGFTKVECVLGSGATDSCAPDCMCPETKSRPSEGSRRGLMYTAAGGEKIANEGEKDITMVTGSNKVVQTNWQIVESSTILKAEKRLRSALKTMYMSWTCGYHRTPRGVFDGRNESLVC